MKGLPRLLFNALTLAPGVDHLPLVRGHLQRRVSRVARSGGSRNARYCYAVWLRHLVLMAEHGLDANPKDVAELGPGASIGTGVTALLCGAEQYAALDVVPHADPNRNLEVFEGLIELLARRAEVPDDDEFPQLWPRLPSYRFPSGLLGERRLKDALAPARLAAIRAAIARGVDARGPVRYFAPWSDPAVVPSASQDVVFSQAVLEHVDALPEVYAAMRRWLRPSGCLSHQIDLKSHQSAPTWDGHWRYGELRWKLERGRRAWLINREPYSEHVRLLEQAGLRVVYSQLTKNAPSFGRDALAQRWRDMPEEDRSISGAYLLAAPRDSKAPGTLRTTSLQE